MKLPQFDKFDLQDITETFHACGVEYAVCKVFEYAAHQGYLVAPKSIIPGQHHDELEKLIYGASAQIGERNG